MEKVTNYLDRIIEMDNFLTIFAGALGALVLILIILLIAGRKRKPKEPLQKEEKNIEGNIPSNTSEPITESPEAYDLTSTQIPITEEVKNNFVKEEITEEPKKEEKPVEKEESKPAEDIKPAEPIEFGKEKNMFNLGIVDDPEEKINNIKKEEKPVPTESINIFEAPEEKKETETPELDPFAIPTEPIKMEPVKEEIKNIPKEEPKPIEDIKPVIKHDIDLEKTDHFSFGDLKEYENKHQNQFSSVYLDEEPKKEEKPSMGLPKLKKVDEKPKEEPKLEAQSNFNFEPESYDIKK